MNAEPEILFERRGAAGLVTLNRPQALNAVTLAMVRALARQLAEWESDAAVTRVIVTASGGRAFSAGGDIRALYDLGRAGRYDEALAFWREEYALNALHQALSQALCGADRRHRHGRRRRHFGAWLPSRRRRPLRVRHAGGRHRLLSRHRGDLVPAAPAGRARRLLRADRRADQRGGRRGRGHRHPPGRVGAVPRADRGAVRHRLGRRDARRLRASRQGRARSRRGGSAIDRLFKGDRVEDILAALDQAAASRWNRAGSPPPPRP